MDQFLTMQLYAEAVVRKRVAAMRKNGESGAGGVSIEYLILIGVAVAVAIAFGIWINNKITEKQADVQ